MTTNRFLDRLQSGAVLVLDGATGTNLQRRGLPTGMPSDLWVLDNPDGVMQLHRDFLEAGSDVLLTDTFGSSRLHLGHAGLTDRFDQTNRRAVQIARQVIEGSTALLGGSMGPLGEMLEPYGPLPEAEAQKVYAEQARILAEEGVDLLVVETQFDLNEARAAVRGAKSVCDLPVVCSFSYDRGTRSMMGVKPAQAGKELAAEGIAAVGINCGRSLEDNFKALTELQAATDLPIWFKPNAGLPRTDEQGRLQYDVTPEMMAAQAPLWIAAGARLVGGCCGTSPEHLAAIAQAVHRIED
jgi:5-methyltetrahydrofolate--homocysteine methyltransferase